MTTQRTVGGVGTHLYFITQVLKQQNCSALWGEATSHRGSYYQHVFQLERVEDLIFAARENVLRFGEKLEREWLTDGDNAATPSEPLKELYALEVENPPFVGSKMAVFNPSKRLSYRFLKLAYNKQIEIAKLSICQR